MKWQRITLATALLGGLAVLAWVPAVWAQADAQDGPAPGVLETVPELQSRPVGRFLAGSLRELRQLRGEVNLTADQRRQLFQAIDAHRPELKQVLGELRQGHRKVMELTWQEEPDEAAIRAAVADLTRAAGDAAVLRAKLLKECRSILTPDQQAKVKAFREGRSKAAGEALGAL